MRLLDIAIEIKKYIDSNDLDDDKMANLLLAQQIIEEAAAGSGKVPLDFSVFCETGEKKMKWNDDG